MSNSKNRTTKVDADSTERHTEPNTMRMPPVSRMIMPEQILERSAQKRKALELATAKATSRMPRR